MTAAALAALTRAASATPAIDLAAANQSADLLTRIDRKYLVDLSQFDQLMSALAGSVRVLTIDGCYVFGYVSQYFDTEDLITYRAHLQQRRRRYKVRTRRYLETGDTFVEVKYKGPRQLTMKVRQRTEIPSVPPSSDLATQFARRVVGEVYGQPLRQPLHASAAVRNRRATFVSSLDRARITVDADVTLEDGSQVGHMREGTLLVETKTDGRMGRADAILKGMGVRPAQISKYCAAIALLRTDVPSNPWRHVIRTHFERQTALER